jgi:erythromycin esterase-like protein
MVVGALLCLGVSGWAAVDIDLGKLFGTSVMPLKTVVAGNGFSDLAPLQKVLKDVQVVGMGECTHGSREVFQMKHRMFEFLVEKMGFTVFALESSMPDTVAMDLYVTKGEGDPETAAAKQGFWTWSTEEVRDLLVWMRKYNLNPKHAKKLRVVGVDMQNQPMTANFLEHEAESVGIKDIEAYEWDAMSYDYPTTEQKKKLDAVFAKLVPLVEQKKGKERAELVKRIITVFHQSVNNNQQQVRFAMAQKAIPTFQTVIADAGALLKEAKGLGSEASWGLDYLANISKIGTMLSEDDVKRLQPAATEIRAASKTNDKIAARLLAVADLLDYILVLNQNKATIGVNYRDKCMAENTEWITKTYLPGQKVMLWAHNGHIANNAAQSMMESMGSYLAKSFGSKYFPIGFAFNSGSFQAMGAKKDGTTGRALQRWDAPKAKADSLEANLDKLGKPILYLDFSRMSADAKKWVDEVRPMRSIGALYEPSMDAQFYQPTPLGKWFRGLIFIAKTTRARPVSQTLQSYGIKKDW